MTWSKLLYQEDGYLNMKGILSVDVPFFFLWGGRGIGKTFGALKYVLENDIRFMFMRRTQSQADLINKEEFSPFKPLNDYLHMDVRPRVISKYNAALVDYVDGEPSNHVRGYTCALSTLSNMRGFDASDVEILIWDEFIPEKHDRPIKNEGAAFLNAVETIGRNRELNGKPPLRVLCLANANTLGNPIFLELGIVNIAYRMAEHEKEIYINRDRGLFLGNIMRSPISNKKEETSLYKLAKKESEFTRMSLSNEFSGEEVGDIGSRPIREYNPICTIGEITIYRHKSRREYYVTELASGSPVTFTSGETDRKRFMKKYHYLYTAYLNNKVVFSSKLTQLLFDLYNK